MKSKIGLTILLLSVMLLDSNAQAFQWAKQFASRNSRGSDVVTDNNFNVISAGWYSDSVDLDPGVGTYWVYDSSTSSGNTSYLSKLDANGSFVWGFSYNRSFNISNSNRIYSVDVDNQDNILVMGQFRDSIDLDFGPGAFMLYDNFVNSSYYDNIFIAKYDPNGNLIWGKGLHSSSSVNNYALWGHGLKVDGSNNVLLTGHFRDSVDFDPGPGVNTLFGTSLNNSSYYGDKFLLKLDVNGNFVWVRQWDRAVNWGNNSWYGSHELDVDANDNIFFPVLFQDSLDADPSSIMDIVYTQGARDICLLKVSPSGNLVWHKELGGAGNDYCHSLATDPSGNIFYSVQTWSGTNSIDMDPGPGVYIINWTNNNWGKVILKLDNNGNFIWALKNLDNSWNNSSWYGEGLATDTAGGLYLTTRIYPNTANNNQWDLDPGPGAFIVGSAGSADIAFQNLDGNGNFVWGGVMGGPGADWSYDICTDKARGVYLTGMFYNTADFDPTPDTSFLTNTPTSVDAFVVKLNNCNRATTQIVQACDSVFFNNQYYFQDTVFQSHYNAFNGCDSAHSIVIDVKTESSDTLNVDTCGSYFWNNVTYSSSGLYTHNYGLPNGCDSIVTIDLTIRYKSSETVNINLCDSMGTTVNGVTYASPGSYNQILTNAAGCDSFLTLNITQVTIDTSVGYISSNVLQSNVIGATSYQWIDCNTLLSIAGATLQNYTATQAGSYACIVTINGCSDTSGCHSVVIHPDAVHDYQIISTVHPNPSKGSYHLALDKEYKNVQLEIRNISGQLIWKKRFDRLKETDVSIDKSVGVYMLYIKQNGITEVKKLLKW